jgi:uncharacterized membrane protein YdbT with pleckstrin-like domain
MSSAVAKEFEREFSDLREPEPQLIPTLDTPPVAKSDLSTYLYPTLIYIPLLVAAIYIVASCEKTWTKVIVVILILFAIVAMHLERQHFDLIKYVGIN